MRIALVSIIATFACAATLAGTPPPKSSRQEAQPDTRQNDIPMEVYMTTLAQISPAAREGATVYQQAFERRCGRALQVIELRRAIAEGDGDSVLMAMIRAAAMRDNAALQRLSGSMPCPDRR
ncbi:MAG: hypothetical protein V4724_20750 [Pseudomonadota bacterium]